MADKYANIAHKLMLYVCDGSRCTETEGCDCRNRIAAALREVERETVEQYRQHFLAAGDGFAWVRISDQKPVDHTTKDVPIA